MKPIYINGFMIVRKQGEYYGYEYHVINTPTMERITYFFTVNEAKEYAKKTV